MRTPWAHTHTHVNRHAYKHIVCMQWVQYQQHQYRLCACLCLVRTIIWLFLFVSFYFDISISHSILWNISHTTHASFYISFGKTTTWQRKNTNIRHMPKKIIEYNFMQSAHYNGHLSVCIFYHWKHTNNWYIENIFFPSTKKNEWSSEWAKMYTKSQE